LWNPELWRRVFKVVIRMFLWAKLNASRVKGGT